MVLVFPLIVKAEVIAGRPKAIPVSGGDNRLGEDRSG
jgi:hypothetical protein